MKPITKPKRRALEGLAQSYSICLLNDRPADTICRLFFCLELIFVMAHPIDLSNLLEQRKKKVIPDQLLEKYGARLVNIKKDYVLFDEGDPARDFYQVVQGQVKMYIINPDGQEFTQGIFGAGESFGEPALLGGFNYPSSAMAIEAGKVWRLPRPEFLQLLKENFEIHIKLDQVLCKRLQYKTMILTEVSSYDPEHRITTLLKYLRTKLIKKETVDKAIIPFTRQQLADMTGLRVETVIRTIKKMEKGGKLHLEGHKIRF
jgi:CRP-like cAMP-binding protein